MQGPTFPRTYEASCEAVAELLLELGLNGGFTQEDIDANVRRPNLATLNFDMGAGHGSPQPYYLGSDDHRNVVDSLLASPHLERLALHQSASLQFYFPDLYYYYHEATIPVRERHDELVPNWTKSILTTAACNFGPQVATYFHRDGRHLSFGMCGIHSAGKYDRTKGGHLVLKEPAEAHHPVSTWVPHTHSFSCNHPRRYPGASRRDASFVHPVQLGGVLPLFRQRVSY